MLYHQDKLYQLLPSPKRKKIEKQYYQLKYDIQAEQDAADALKELDQARYNRYIPNQDLARMAYNRLEKLNNQYKATNSIIFKQALVKIRCLGLFNINKFKELKSLALEGLQKAQKYGLIKEEDEHFFRLHYLKSALFTHDLQVAERVLQKVNTVKDISIEYQLAYKNIQFRLLLNKQQFVAADQLLAEVKQISELKELPSNIQELWHLNEAFIILLSHIKFAPFAKRSYRSQSFLNKVPTLSKYKQSYNISIRLVDLLIKAKKKQSQELFKLEDTVRKYSNRYLHPEQNARTTAFINHILSYVNKGSSYQAAQLAFLDEVKDYQILEPCEVIPYEIIWEVIAP